MSPAGPGWSLYHRHSVGNSNERAGVVALFLALRRGWRISVGSRPNLINRADPGQTEILTQSDPVSKTNKKQTNKNPQGLER